MTETVKKLTIGENGEEIVTEMEIEIRETQKSVNISTEELLLEVAAENTAEICALKLGVEDDDV